MISPPLSPDPAVTAALRQMLQDAVWAASFERACDTGFDALNAKVARYTSALAAREPELDAPIEAVTVALRAAARELHPDSPAATESLGAVSEAVPEDPSPGERWSPEWACEYMGEALRRLAKEYPADADVPDLDAETDEIYAASDAEDRERYRRAVDTWLESALRRTSVQETVGAEDEDSAWDEDWAATEIARAISYISSRVQAGDDPAAHDQWRAVIAAQAAKYKQIDFEGCKLVRRRRP